MDLRFYTVSSSTGDISSISFVVIPKIFNIEFDIDRFL